MEEEVGASDFCSSAELTSNVDGCRGGPLIGAWAINGEVSNLNEKPHVK
jgi:hypothetical protein